MLLNVILFLLGPWLSPFENVSILYLISKQLSLHSKVHDVDADHEVYVANPLPVLSCLAPSVHV